MGHWYHLAHRLSLVHSLSCSPRWLCHTFPCSLGSPTLSPHFTLSRRPCFFPPLGKEQQGTSTSSPRRHHICPSPASEPIYLAFSTLRDTLSPRLSKVSISIRAPATLPSLSCSTSQPFILDHSHQHTNALWLLPPSKERQLLTPASLYLLPYFSASLQANSLKELFTPIPSIHLPVFFLHLIIPIKLSFPLLCWS